MAKRLVHFEDSISNVYESAGAFLTSSATATQKLKYYDSISNIRLTADNYLCVDTSATGIHYAVLEDVKTDVLLSSTGHITNPDNLNKWLPEGRTGEYQ
jgi:hypothetical protein